MADSKISALTAVTTPDNADEFPVNDAGTTKKITLGQVKTFVDQRGVNALVTAQGAGFATDTYVTNSNIAIPAGRLQAKTFYRVMMQVSKTAAGTGTPVISIRVGTAGTTADTARATATWPAANTAAIDSAWIEIQATFRTVGSGTSAVLHCAAVCQHQTTTTGFGGTGTTNIIIMTNTGGGFDSTVANLQIGFSINAGTGAAWTINSMVAELGNLV